MNLIGKSKAPLWVKSDLDATFGVFFDGFSKVIAASGIMVGLMNMPADIVYKKVMPGIALSVFLLNLFFWWQGRQLCEKTGRTDVTALPTGLQAGRVFIWLFSIMLPTYLATKDPVLAWTTGCAANFIGAFVYMIGGLIAPKLVKIIPAGALFGGLAGGAVAWLAINSLGSIFNYPIIGYTALMVLLVLYLAKIETRIPGALISIGIGTILAWATKLMTPQMFTDALKNVHPGFPFLHFDFFGAGFAQALKFLPIIIVFSFGEAISSLQGIEQAREAGDDFSVTQTLIACGVLNIIASIVGSPFALGVFWGHVAWKKIKAGTGYSLAVGIMYLIICTSGIVAIINGIIPAIATLPMLVFIGLSSAGQAFEIADKKYYPAVVFAMLPTTIELMYGKITSAANAGLNVAKEAIKAAGANVDLSNAVVGVKDLQAAGVDANGFMVFSQGSGFVCLVLGAVLCFVTDRKWKEAAYAALVGAVLTFFGIIHSASVKINANPTYLGIYLATAAVFFIMELLKVGKDVDRKHEKAINA